MTEIGAELVERVLRWCGEAGRQAGVAEVREALAPLGWDELLAVKALLVDPPPARPLGPYALADLARGTPADVAAEREREGRYRPEDGSLPAGDGAPPPPADRPAPTPTRARTRRRARADFVIHRARDRVGPAAAGGEPDPRRPLEELLRPEGRSVLERLVRRSGASRARLAAALAASHRAQGGGGVQAEDLDALLREHGLARAFERRERDETLHAVRAAGGLLGAAAERLGLDRAGLEAAVARLGIGAPVEHIRDERRADLRARATLGERARLLAGEGPRLADLGLAAEFEADLRARLPEHVRALRASGEPILAALARTLSLPRAETESLVARCGIDLPRAAPRPRGDAAAPRAPASLRPRPSVPPRTRGERPRGAPPRGGGDRGGPPPGAGRGPPRGAAGRGPPRGGTGRGPPRGGAARGGAGRGGSGRSGGGRRRGS